MKGRGWLIEMAARAYDNGIYVVFKIPIGDGWWCPAQETDLHDPLLIPFRRYSGECTSFEDGFVTATLTPEKKLTQAGGYRYIKARQPDLKILWGRSSAGTEVVLAGRR